jgi:3-phosphoshikimate 1-carboxyvinyltransferase
MRGGPVSIDAGESSQLLTGLLIALPLASENSEINVAHAVSKGYLDLTIDTCAAFGVRIEKNHDYSGFSIQGKQHYRSGEFHVEGDWSGAAFLVVAAAIATGNDELEISGLRTDSSQPDKAVLTAARMAGAAIRIGKENVYVKKGSPRAFEFDATDCPDLFPPLAVLAAACPGTSILRGIHRLAGKESDRAASLKTCLESLGVCVTFDGDSMLVHGGNLSGGIIDSSGDHRIAMAAAVAALAAAGPVTILGSECVAKSWPGFFGDLASICV